MAIHGTMPAIQPSQNGIRLPPGSSYFSWTAPKKIMAALTPNSATSAAASRIPGSAAMSTIITDDDSEYSTHRK